MNIIECPRCHKQMPDNGQNYCTYCGQLLNRQTQPYENMSTQYIQPDNNIYGQNVNYPAATDKKKSHTALIITCVCVAVAFVIGVLLFVFRNQIFRLDFFRSWC